MSERLPQLELKTVMHEHLTKGHFTHYYASCGSLKDRKIYFKDVHLADRKERFDLASLTKIIVTTPLVFWTLEVKSLSLNTTITHFLGKKHLPFSKFILGLTVRQLLNHTSGLKDWLALWVQCMLSPEMKQTLDSKRWLIKRLNDNGVKGSVRNNEPYCYSDLGYIALGLCLEEIWQERLDEIFKRFCEEKLGLFDINLQYNNNAVAKANSISCGFCHVRNAPLHGEVHDENAAVLNGIAGHAGVFGSGEAIELYFTKLFNSSIGQNIIMENSNCMKRDAGMIGLAGFHQGAGYSSEVFMGGGTIGHLGFTGTSLWIDPRSLKFGLLLTNRVVAGRLASWINEFRHQVYSLFNQIVQEHIEHSPTSKP